MLVKNADGPSGDKVKYEHAVGSRLSLSSQHRLLAFGNRATPRTVLPSYYTVLSEVTASR